jgi:hypothetical protein
MNVCGRELRRIALGLHVLLRSAEPGELTKPSYLLIRLLATPTNRRAPPA